MSQYSTRINIKVASKDVWKKISTINFERCALSPDLAHAFEKYEGQNFIINGDFSMTEVELERFVDSISDVCRSDKIIIIGDTTNINVDSYSFCVYYLGGNVKTRCFEDGSKKSEMFYMTNIEKISEWLEYGGFRIYEKEVGRLRELGISLNCGKKSSKQKPQIYEKADINIAHRNKYISKIRILVSDPKEFLKLKKNFFRTNNFQYCTDIDDAKAYFKEYKQKSFIIENWDIAPSEIQWFCLSHFNFDCIVLLETRKNKPNSAVTYYCQFPHPDRNDTIVTLKEPIKADISSSQEWMKEIKVRMTAKRKQFLEKCQN